MKGRVLDYSIQSNSGDISGDDGNRYNFGNVEWKGQGLPSRGLYVDFAIQDDRAVLIYPALDESGSTASAIAIGQKSKIVAGILALLLGGFGAHKFYLGMKKQAVIMLLGVLVGWILILPLFIVGVTALIEGIIYLTKSDEEFHETYVVGKKAWF